MNVFCQVTLRANMRCCLFIKKLNRATCAKPALVTTRDTIVHVPRCASNDMEMHFKRYVKLTGCLIQQL